MNYPFFNRNLISSLYIACAEPSQALERVHVEPMEPFSAAREVTLLRKRGWG